MNNVRGLAVMVSVLALGGTLLAVTPSIPVARAQDAQGVTEVTQDAVRTGRKAIVANYMQLTDAEAAKFWPVYDEYQNDLAVPERRLAGVADNFSEQYPNMTDAEAKTILQDVLNAEKNIVDRRRIYMGRFDKVLPAKKVFRLYQIEAKMDAALQHNLSGRIPLVK